MQWYEIILIIDTFIGSFYFWFQFYKIIEIDACNKGLKRQRIWALFAINQDNRMGLLLYLIVGENTYPIFQNQIYGQSTKKRKSRSVNAGSTILVIMTLAQALI